MHKNWTALINMRAISLEWLYLPIKYDLIVLNTPMISGLYEKLYPQASRVILTDGASNQIHEYLHLSKNDFFPSQIVGDMDSISEQARKFFERTPLIVDSNQDKSDLDKALLLTKSDTVVMIAEPSGRIDHLLKIFSCQHEYLELNKNVFLVTNNSLLFLVKGETEIQLYDFLRWNYYGLVPLNGPATVTTKGFKWNLKNQILNMGGLVSTSNKAQQNDIYIKTSNVLVFTCSSSV